MLLKSIIVLSFIGILFFFSCNKTSEKEEDNATASIENISPEPVDTSVVESEAINPPAETKEETVPVLESVVPEQIRRPQQGESPRLPEDAIIGILGAGEASVEAFRFAQEKLRELLDEDLRLDTLSNLPPEESERIIGILEDLSPLKVRIGGGREEIDESVSFLFRIIGTTNWSGGEMYIRQNEDTWNVENLILDDSREQDAANNQYRFDLPPYERFF